MRSISDDVAIHNQGKNFLGGCRAVSGFAHSGLVYVVYQVRVAEPFVSAHRVCLCLVSATSGLAGAIVVVFVWIFSQKRSTTQTSLIQNPQLNFVLTGYGSALQIQHIILLFLSDLQSAWTIDICTLSQVSTNLFRITVTWRQVDTPSVASGVDVALDHDF